MAIGMGHLFDWLVSAVRKTVRWFLCQDQSVDQTSIFESEFGQDQLHSETSIPERKCPRGSPGRAPDLTAAVAGDKKRLRPVRRRYRSDRRRAGSRRCSEQNRRGRG